MNGPGSGRRRFEQERRGPQLDPTRRNVKRIDDGEQRSVVALPDHCPAVEAGDAPVLGEPARTRSERPPQPDGMARRMVPPRGFAKRGGELGRPTAGHSQRAKEAGLEQLPEISTRSSLPRQRDQCCAVVAVSVPAPEPKRQNLGGEVGAHGAEPALSSPRARA